MKMRGWHSLCFELRSKIHGRRQLLVASIFCSTFAVMYIFQKWHINSSHILSHPFFNYSLFEEEPIDSEQVCQIPRIHPFDKSIWKYLTPVGPLRCSSRQPQLTYIDCFGYLRLNYSELKVMGYDEAEVACMYRPILQYPGEDDNFYFGTERLLIPEGAPIVHDFISVDCHKWNFANIKVKIYEGMHAHMRNFSRTNLLQEPAINVAVFGVDSLSRLSFIRLLPKTYHYLTKTMDAFVFRGMNKVGDNTFPNICAMITGYELYGGVLPHPPKIKHYDNWPVIWRNFSEDGHATLLAEDLPEYSMFNYLTTGFYRQPTDHYLRPFWLAVSKSSLLRTSSHLCLDRRPRHMLQIRYLLDFMQKYPRFFAFSWLSEVTHDYLQRSSVLDEDFEATLRNLHGSGILNNTILIFMSDHGHRFNSIRETLIGRLEERLPFVSIVVPNKLKHSQNQIMSGLQQNAGRLVTPFDMYTTFLDVLRYNKEGVDLGNYRFRHGFSLFGPIPFNRTCDEAGVPENFCACGEETELSIEDHRVKAASQALVKHLNDRLSANKSVGNVCAFLTINQVKSAHVVVPKKNAKGMTADKVTADRQVITVVVQTKPGLGIFEATVIILSNEVNVSGDVSRINMYRGQSDCIQNRTLRMFCYCKILQ